MNSEELEARIQLLEDVEAIKQLKSRYARACDDGYNIDMFRQLFADDMVFDQGAAGLVQGKENVLDFLAEVSKDITFAVHYFILPDIRVDGGTATGRWYMWMPCTYVGGHAVWISSVEDDKYSKIDGRWLLSYIKLTDMFRTPYEQGWHKQKRLEFDPGWRNGYSS